MNKTELSFATVSNLCNELKNKGVLREQKINSISVGRTPSTLLFNYDRYYSVCLNMQLKDQLGFALMDFRNNAIYKESYNISEMKTPEEIIAFSNDKLKEVMKQKKISAKGAVGVGAAVPGVFNITNNRVINCAIPMLENVSLKQMIEEEFSLPAYVDNESNLCTLAVKLFNSKSENIIYLHISEGVGVGIVTEGKLLRGKNGWAAEISHIPIGNPEIKCLICGEYGCVESDLSLEGITRDYGEKNYLSNSLLFKWEQFAASVKNKERKALDVVKDKGILLGKLCSILINLFDPEVMYIGGNIADIYNEIEPYMLNALIKYCRVLKDSDLQVICDRNSDETIYKGINETVYSKWNPLIST